MRLISCFPAALDDNGVIRPREAMDILRPGSAMICTRPVGHERASRRGSDRLFDAEKIFVELQHSTVRVLFRMHGSVRAEKITTVRENCFALQPAAVRKRCGNWQIPETRENSTCPRKLFRNSRCNRVGSETFRISRCGKHVRENCFALQNPKRFGFREVSFRICIYVSQTLKFQLRTRSLAGVALIACPLCGGRLFPQ
jgi:hypothetical protein